MRLALFIALFFLGHLAFAATNSTPNATSSSQPATNTTSAKPPPATRTSRSTSTSELLKTIDQLRQSNRDLLDLLKQQQDVLADMQYDRRQQARRLESLEERLTEAQLLNAQLQNKVTNLETEAAVRPPATTPQSGTIIGKPFVLPSTSTNSVVVTPEPSSATAPPATPDTYLPPPDTEGMPGTKSWHRLFTLKGTDDKQTDLFQIQSRTWRVLWHNQDPPEKNLKGTSGLFIDAFPKDDTIPQHVCAKVGTGNDSTELVGPGNYYLKVTASGGAWELAVEDFR